jgi:hypothetical protein
MDFIQAIMNSSLSLAEKQDAIAYIQQHPMDPALLDMPTGTLLLLFRGWADLSM